MRDHQVVKIAHISSVRYFTRWQKKHLIILMNGGQSVVIIFVIKGGIPGIRAIVAHALHRHLDLLELDPKLKS